MMSDSPNESPTYQPVNVFVYLPFSSAQFFFSSQPGIGMEPPLAGWLAGYQSSWHFDTWRVEACAEMQHK